MGVKVSKPLTALQGKPFFFTSSWRFLAVISTASAMRHGQRGRAWEAGWRRTIPGDVRVRVGLGDVSAALANDEAKLDCTVVSEASFAGVDAVTCLHGVR